MPPTSHHDPFGLPPGDAFGDGGAGVADLAPQVEALTQAIENLTARLGTGGAAPSAAAYTPGSPWWFYTRQGRPGAPDAPPPGSAAARDAESPWWGKYADPGPAEDFTYVRSFWRAKPRPKPPAEQPAAVPDAATAAAAVQSGYPDWVTKIAESTGESPAEIAAAMGVRPPAGAAGGGRGGRGGKPPWWSAYTNASPDPPGGGDPGRGQRGEPWWGKYFRSAGNAVPPPPRTSPRWDRKRSRHPWHWNTTRRVAGFARLMGGKRAGRMAMAGMSAAAQRFAFSGNFASAARVGIMGGAAAGGAAAFGAVALGVAAVKAAEALNRMTAEQLTYNRELSKSSAQMALVFAQRDVRETFRQREIGDAVAESARRLTGAEQLNADRSKELDVFLERFKNNVGTGWELFKAFFSSLAEPFALTLNRISDAVLGATDREKVLTLGEWAKEAQQQDEQARKRKDPKWEPPKLR